MRNKEGAFSIYTDIEIELVGFTTCDGCPGGNIEYAGEESFLITEAACAVL
jgi:predicted metal-binding protein